MTTVKRLTDLTNYVTVLPYASEIFGVYQPLLGWKSQRVADRFNEGLKNDKSLVLDKFKRQFIGLFDIRRNPPNPNSVNQPAPWQISIAPGILAGGKVRSFDSLLLE